MSERKRLIFTATIVSLVGIATGLFLGGYLTPHQLYDVRVTTIKTETSVVDNQGDHTVTRVVTTTETVPRGYTFTLPVTSTTVPGASVAKQPANEVWITSLEFKPSSLTVPVGTRVTWVNKEGENHTVTSAKRGLFDGGLEPFGTFSFTFTEPGNYEYACSPHEAMVGVIIVK